MGFLTIIQLFDIFLTDLPLPPSTSSYLTIIRVALVDESVDKLVLSIIVSGKGGHIDLGASDELLSESLLRPSLSPPSSPTPNPPFLGLVVDSVLLEVFNIEVSGAAIRLTLG